MRLDPSGTASKPGKFHGMVWTVITSASTASLLNPRSIPMLVIIFTISMFLSAALLFLVEPMLAKMLLPLLGGTPAVWNTCLVFFQAVLLAGYLYAHASMRWLGRRTQIAVHLAVVAAALLVLPLGVAQTRTPPAQGNPVQWILITLLATVGLPFFALSASAPIMQKWFAQTRHTSAGDPYFLY